MVIAKGWVEEALSGYQWSASYPDQSLVYIDLSLHVVLDADF